MSRRYSASDREMAANVCSARASAWKSWPDAPLGACIAEWGWWFDASRPAMALARAAVAASRDDSSDFGDEWAEAEALIRTGWVPS